MKVYLLVDESGVTIHPVGVYSTPQKALAAMRTMQDSSEAVVREYEVDDAVTHNFVRIYDPR
jgi:hypothetical protein